MLDAKFVREETPKVRKSEKKRRGNDKLVKEFLEWDELYRTALRDSQNFKAIRNKHTEEIAKFKREGKDVKKEISKMKKVSEEIKDLDSKADQYKEKRDDTLYQIGNILEDDVPEGKDENDNVEIKKHGKIPKFKFKLKSHGELLEENGVANFEKAAENSGNGFNYLMGDMVLLDRALQQYGIDFMISKNFTLVQPPYMMRTDVMKYATDLDAFNEAIYQIQDEDLALITTSEHPIAALFKDEVIEEEKLPILLTGISPCFRKEIGSHGVDTKGLYRMHQFHKVEQFVICRPEDSWEWFEKMQKMTEELIQSLEIPYRVLLLCGADSGIKAAKQYDIEAWFPRQDKYGEITSCSNCTDYQSIGLNVKFGKYGGDKAYVHMLNNTAIATSRIMVAILENFQNEDGSVDVPKVLQKYVGKKKLFSD